MTSGRLTTGCSGRRPFWTNQNGRFWPLANLNFTQYLVIRMSALPPIAAVELIGW